MTAIDASRSLKTWQEVFEQHSISDVKVFEKQLRSSVIRDKERLRVLVGGNYRDLLSTADEIVALDERSKDAESYISGLSSKCKPPTLEHATPQPAEYAAKAAQLRLLGRCNLCATNLLKSRSFLASAQLCLISRLLLKSLTERKTPPQALDRLRNQADAIRQHLIRHTDAQLTHPSSSFKTLVEAVCAVSLVKSISAADAITHFRDLRLFKLRQRLDHDTYNVTSIEESFRYLVQSAQSLRALLSRGVHDVLTSLQRQPILENPTISRIDTLGLENIRTLIPTDVLTFTPFIKRVVMQKSDVEEAVQTWTIEASTVASAGLSRMLSLNKSLSEILSLRRALLGVVLPVYFSTNAQDALLQSIRQTTNQRLSELCKNQNEHVLHIVEDMLTNSSSAATPPSMWEDSFIQRPLVSNSVDFLRQVQTRHLGIHGSLERSLKRLRSWVKSYKLLRSQIHDIRQLRWQDVIEEAEEEDEDAAAKVIELLATTDPSHLESSVNTTIKTAISTLNSQIEKHVTDFLMQDHPPISRIVFLLRAIRELSAIIGQVVSDNGVDATKVNEALHKALAAHVLQELRSKVEASGCSDSMTSIVAEDLPSPRVFTVLRELSMIMEEIGGADLWSAQAVATTKKQLQEAVFAGEDTATYAQTKFDEQYLRAALSISRLRGSNESKGEDAALAYWHRTKLLFGPLS